MIDKSILINKLRLQGYSEQSARLVTNEMVNISNELLPYVESWITSEQLDYSVNGYKLFDLMGSRNMTYPAALLTIDWLIKDPNKAIKSLSRTK